MKSDLILRDPYSAFRVLRRESPICRLDTDGPWLISRYSDVLGVLKDSARFRSSRPRTVDGPIASPADPIALLQTRGLVGEDAPTHTRLRSQIKSAFTPSRLRSLENQIRHLARERIQNLRQREEFDFVGDFAKSFPLDVIAMLIGVPREKARDFERWVNLLVNWNSPSCVLNKSEVANTVAEMHEFFSAEITDCSRREGHDLISVLSQSVGRAESRLASHELLVFLRLLIVAGSETTTHLMSNMFLALLHQPDLWETVKMDTGLIPALIEESLRFDSPVPALIRWVAEDISMGGFAIQKNDAVLALIASANHDESLFVEPEKFDLRRASRPHLSFGAGSHYCMGVMLARLQVRLVFEELFASFTHLGLLRNEPIERVESFFVRGPTSLRIKMFGRKPVNRL